MTSDNKHPGGSLLGGWVFLGCVAVSYGICAIAAPDVLALALSELMTLSVRVLPVLGGVFFLLFLIDIFINRQWILRHLGKAAGIKGWALTIGCGVLSAGPLFVWYPLLADLKAKGMSGALLSVFLYSRALKLPLLPLMVHYFGLAYTILFSVSILVFSVLIGWLMGLLVDDRPPKLRNETKRLQ